MSWEDDSQWAHVLQDACDASSCPTATRTCANAQDAGGIAFTSLQHKPVLSVPHHASATRKAKKSTFQNSLMTDLTVCAIFPATALGLDVPDTLMKPLLFSPACKQVTGDVSDLPIDQAEAVAALTAPASSSS